MTAVLYLASLDPALGGPVASTVELQKLVSVDGDVLVSSGDRDQHKLARSMRETGLGADTYLPAAALSETLKSGGATLHLQNVWDPKSIELARVARRFGNKTILSPRGALDSWSLRHRRWKKTTAKGLYARLYWSQVDVLHCTAQREAAQVEQLLGSRTPNVAIVPNVVNARYAALKSRSEDTVRAIYVGRFHEKKRPDLVLEGCSDALLSGRLEQLTFVGNGSREWIGRLTELVERHGLGSRVTFAGWRPADEIPDLLAEHDVLLLPTSQENFGRVLFEAMLAGLCVMTTDRVDCWPELEQMGAWRIEQCRSSIGDAINRFVDLSLGARSESARAGSAAASRYLASDQLKASYRRLYFE